MNSQLLTHNSKLSSAWFAVRTQTKREHIAARWLHTNLDIEVFLPRIRFRRAQPRGPVWFTEALFPNYLFARFDLAELLQQVDCAPGIRGVVRFGWQCPTVPQDVIAALQTAFGPEEVRELDDEFGPGESVWLRTGPLRGFEAVVSRVLPARERIVVLLEFLGRQTMVEVEAMTVSRMGEVRTRVSF